MSIIHIVRDLGEQVEPDAVSAKATVTSPVPTLASLSMSKAESLERQQLLAKFLDEMAINSAAASAQQQPLKSALDAQARDAALEPRTQGAARERPFARLALDEAARNPVPTNGPTQLSEVGSSVASLDRSREELRRIDVGNGNEAATESASQQSRFGVQFPSKGPLA